jgi:hypothetical protein
MITGRGILTGSPGTPRPPIGTKRPAKPICSRFAGTAATLRRGFSNNRVPYVATLSTGPYLLLEGATPTAILYPKRRGVNNRRACQGVVEGPEGIRPHNTATERASKGRGGLG